MSFNRTKKLPLITIDDVVDVIPEAARVAIGSPLILLAYSRAQQEVKDLLAQSIADLEFGKPLVNVAYDYNDKAKKLDAELNGVLALFTAPKSGASKVAIKHSKLAYTLLLTHGFADVVSKLDLNAMTNKNLSELIESITLLIDNTDTSHHTYQALTDLIVNARLIDTPLAA